MNKKGNIGSLVIFFVGVIVALALLPAIAVNQAALTDTHTAINVTYTMAAAGSFIDLNGQEYISGIQVINETGTGTVPTTNYTISEGISATTGHKTITLTTVTDSPWDSVGVNVSYVYGPDGYADSAGGRAIAGIIVLMTCLGLLGFALFYGAGKVQEAIS